MGRKNFKLLAIILIILTTVIGYWSRASWQISLADANCQTTDIGSMYQASDELLHTIFPETGEEPIAQVDVMLLDSQLSNTVLYCRILQYEDQLTARQALEAVCKSPKPHETQFGRYSCHFSSTAPQSLAFQRKSYLVLMLGDVQLNQISRAVDGRLR